MFVCVNGRPYTGKAYGRHGGAAGMLLACLCPYCFKLILIPEVKTG